MGNHVRRAAAFALAATLMGGGLLALAPTGNANVALEGPFVVQGWWPYSPQLHCTVVFDHPSEHRCSVTGPANMITHLRARIVGQATVHAALDRVLDDGARLPLAVLDCTSSCVMPLHDGREPFGTFALDVVARGGANTMVSVDVEQQTGLVLP